MVLVMVLMTLLVIAGFTLGRSVSFGASRVHPATHHSVVVEPGETLWALAVRIAPHQDPRLVVADIESLNHLADADVEPGQQLLVPTIG
jgi:LysM repeat protein